MLFKNNMSPALATVGADTAGGAQTNDIFIRDEMQEDFNAFGRPAQRPAQNPQRKPRPANSGRPSGTGRPTGSGRPQQHHRRPQSRIPWKLILFAGIAVVALILVIVMIVAIFAAPKKNIKMEDNVYFSFVDNDGKYRVVSNDHLISTAFDGEIEIISAKDASFAYIVEKIPNGEKKGYKLHLIEDKKLTSIEATSDSKPLALADYEPGIVYKQNGRTYYYSKNDQTPINSDASASNFLISGDATTVVYTVESDNKNDTLELKYFRNGGSTQVGPYNFTPWVISNDGKYIYGIFRNTLCYVSVEDNGETYNQGVISNNTFGEILGITGINVVGNEIIFCAQPANKNTSVSYMYKQGDTEPKQIAEGVFSPVYADSDIVCPETFLNSYFVCKKNVTDEEGDVHTETSTYFLDKKEGARKMADATGKFSPDKKYFYYINEDQENTLIQVKLNSKDFSKNLTAVLAGVTDFEITEGGDIYALAKDVDKAFIYFWDRSDKNRTVVTSYADLDSMKFCLNSVFFSETNEDNVTKIYVSTNGSAKKEAEFKSSTLTKSPEIAMGAAKKGYAYFIDENGSTKLFYTSNGKKFSVISDSCKIPNFTKEPETLPDAE